MRWRRVRQSKNVEDRRGSRVGRGAKMGGGIGTLILLVLGLFLGTDLTQFFSTGDLAYENGSAVSGAQDDENVQFVSAILASTEDVWAQQFAARSGRYQEPKLVLFSGQVNSACGFASAASGPFYCPGDNQVYIDLSFFNQLESMGGVGDFARAYVIGHEIGHHVQNLLGISMAVQRERMQMSEADGNALSVRAELQADCYAGVWAHHAHKQSYLLEEGDIEEGLRTAAAIGDDEIMRRAGQYVRPDAFTHGTSEQRATWFLTGLKSGQMESCTTLPMTVN
ncbi:neutral zinc metallopeptidase [Granulosicoccaceae sp. 1_MG-2023]|nr:neutral zinc metallopeptidase [Granulosicoccaceae sp. 1_MG-2023]